MPAPRALTEVDQANAALAEIGEPGIVSLDEPRRAAARHAKRHFATIRDGCLRVTSWEFAKDWCTPSAIANFAPPSGLYLYRYRLPEECLAVNWLEGVVNDAWETPNAGTDDELALVLDTSVVAPRVCFTRRVVNPAQWDAQFSLLFQLRLAAKLNPLIGRDKTLTERLHARAEDLEEDAMRRDAQAKGSTQLSRDTSWLRARLGYFNGMAR